MARSAAPAPGRRSRTASQRPVPNLRKEVQGLLFLFLATLLGGSLISYHPADALFWNVAGSLGLTRNWFGPIGSHLAGLLVDTVGFSSFWLVLFALGAAVRSFLGRHVGVPALSLLAGLVLLGSSSGLLGLHFPGGIPFRGGMVLAGGLAGRHLADFFSRLFNTYGAYTVLGTLCVITLIIVTRFSLGRILSRLLLAVLFVLRKIREVWIKRRERKSRAIRTRPAHHELKSKRPITIVTPPPEPPPPPAQERFAFMQGAEGFILPSLDLLDDPPPQREGTLSPESLEMNARILEKKLEDFGVQGEVVEALPGPVITMYEFQPAPGVKISKVAGLADDLALALRAPSIRIVAPIPGKAAIGLEIPNHHRETVFLKEIIASKSFVESRHELPLALGKDITGSPVVTDLGRMPHLLVAGATGAGKSISINAMIQSILFKRGPDSVRFLIIDPKRIELSIYNDIPHLLHPVVTEPKEATLALRWAVDEMERRYRLLSEKASRNIQTYNRKLLKSRQAPGREEEPEQPLPYIVLVIDELADLMMASARQVEESITRLAQMARAAGLHLIIATQRPSVDVITGIIKANFPARISFQVSSRVDSRTILDSMGAEALLGEGDMLFMPPGLGRLARIHGAFVSEDEVKRVTDFLRAQQAPSYDETILQEPEESELLAQEMEKDEKYPEAVQLVLETGQASISMIQRRLRVGYNRAARMIEAMEMEGIVGPSDGIRPREVNPSRR